MNSSDDSYMAINLLLICYSTIILKVDCQNYIHNTSPKIWGGLSPQSPPGVYTLVIIVSYGALQIMHGAYTDKV